MHFYSFGSSNTVESPALKGHDKEILGGKGANLAEMTKLNIPVPPGFTIPTNYCIDYLEVPGQQQFMDAVLAEVMKHMKSLDSTFGYMPLVSVRSGARVSMPGMMDTILNVGMTTDTLDDWCYRIGDRAALDSYRRLIQMLGEVALGVPGEVFEEEIKLRKLKEDVTQDCDLSEEGLVELVSKFKKHVVTHAGKPFPNTLESQLRVAIEAVFKSWNNPRAIAYRKMNGYSDDWGTAVNIQSMVFGNMNDKSATGVLFTRNPSTGFDAMVGEFLVNAQGEDVVAGVRTPEPIQKMNEWNQKILDELGLIANTLESHFKDMQDIEFTVQDGVLYLLQTRNAKRSSKAAFKVAHDLFQDGMITKVEMIGRVKADDYFKMLEDTIDPAFKDAPDIIGIAGGGGVVSGVAVFSSGDAVNCNEPCILVAEETTPKDIEGMHASLGILTSTGGLTSHAAVVARGMNKSCVTGCTDMEISDGVALWSGEDDNYNFTAGDKVTIDGATGRVWVGQDVPVVKGEATPEASFIAQAAMELAPYIPYSLNPADAVSGKLYVKSGDFENTSLKETRVGLRLALEEILKGSEVTVVLDMGHREASMAPEDAELEFMCYAPHTHHALADAKLRAVEDLGSLNNRIVLLVGDTYSVDDLSVVLKLGAKLIKTVSTFKDIVESDGKVMVDSMVVEKLFGGAAYFQKLQQSLKGTDMEFDVIEAPMYPESMIYAALG